MKNLRIFKRKKEEPQKPLIIEGYAAETPIVKLEESPADKVHLIEYYKYNFYFSDEHAEGQDSEVQAIEGLMTAVKSDYDRAKENSKRPFAGAVNKSGQKSVLSIASTNLILFDKSNHLCFEFSCISNEEKTISIMLNCAKNIKENIESNKHEKVLKKSYDASKNVLDVLGSHLFLNQTTSPKSSEPEKTIKK